MNKSSTTVLPLLALSLISVTLPRPASAQDDEEEFTCRDGLFGTRSCQSDSGTTIKSRPDLFGNTNSTITRPDGSTTKCCSRQGLFGTITTVCE
ncbi:hypothetical protein [Cyanobium gracile]|uniref:hypothetical protein n=1 Tax=Cyanobium gracile TaxID=59930 RepID=UPI002B212175|nr:hypothetical protein [Cyanobium gracile]